MQSIHVSRDFNTDAKTIFEFIADHANYTTLPGVRAAWLRTPGDEEIDGVGAERVIQLPGIRFVERITDYEPNEILGYRIIESPLPIDHVGARILLQPLGTSAIRTRVHWSSRLRGTTPVGAEAAAFVIAQKMRLAHRAALAIWARHLSA